MKRKHCEHWQWVPSYNKYDNYAWIVHRCIVNRWIAHRKVHQPNFTSSNPPTYQVIRYYRVYTGYNRGYVYRTTELPGKKHGVLPEIETLQLTKKESLTTHINTVTPHHVVYIYISSVVFMSEMKIYIYNSYTSEKHTHNLYFSKKIT